MLREDTRFVDQLFNNNSQKDKARIRSFVKNNTFDLAINYPRTELALPAIVILLKNESESQAYLGDTMGYELPEEMSYDDEIEDVLGGENTVSSSVGNGGIVYGPFYILSATNNTIKVSDKTFVVDDFVGKAYTLRVVGGTGSGQVRNITANSNNSIMVASNWTVNPDNTSILEIHRPDPDIIGEPDKLYPRRNAPKFLERKGSLYTNNYQLQVIAGSQEDTIYLYTIVKSIMTLSRTFLEKQGIINLKMSGSDFSNRPDYVPTVAYMRTLSMQFDAPFEVYEQESEVATNFVISLYDEEDTEVSHIELDVSTEPTISGP
jgi:hypothetical protein